MRGVRRRESCSQSVSVTQAMSEREEERMLWEEETESWDILC